MKKRPLTFTVLAAAAMISLGVGASMASGGGGTSGGGSGGSGGGGNGGGGPTTTTTIAPAPPVVDPNVPAAQTPPPVVVPPVDPVPAPVVLPTADIQLIGKASTGSPVPGSTYSWNYTVKNSGTGTAAAVVFRDELPLNAFLPNWTLNGQQLQGCVINGRLDGGATVVCTIDTLPKGGSVNISIMVTAPEVAATVTNTASIGSDQITDPNTANNAVTASTTIKAPTGSVCKGGACDLVPSVQAAPCAALTAVSAPVGYYLTYAAIWNTFTMQSCSSSSEAVSVQVQELNTITGAIDYDVTWFSTLTPSQNFSMVLDNDFAAYSTPYIITYTVRDSSGNVLNSATTLATTPGPR